MSKFRELIQIEGVDDGEKKAAKRASRGSKKTSTARGCDHCSLNSIKGIKKIFGKVRGKSIFIWGQSPGATENKDGQELVGKAGKWWWKEAEAAGLTRDQCDIQNVVRCLDGGTRVYLPDRSTRHLRGLVVEQYDGYVLTYDKVSKKFVPGKVVGWYRSRRQGRKLYKVSYVGAKLHHSSPIGVIATEDHKFLTKGGWVRADELDGLELNIGPQGVGIRAEQVALGTILGDSHIPSGRSHIEFSHSVAQEEWMRLKARILGAKVGKIRERKEGDRGLPHRGASTHASRFYAQIRSRFYNKKSGKKHVPKWLYGKMGPQALATWYMDDGSIRGSAPRRPSVEFAVCSFSAKSVRRLLNILRSFGFTPWTRGEDNRRRIFLGVEDAPRFVDMISAYVPPSMRYKLGSMATKEFDSSLWEYEGVSPLYAHACVSEVIRDYDQDDMLYCLEISGTHNFVTSVGVTHNCCPADPDPEMWPPYQIRNSPTKEEIHCCSVYNEEASEKSQAKVHIILGLVAAKILLKNEFTKNKRIFWSKKLNARVVCLDHPAFFLRRGGGVGEDPRLAQFRRDLRYAVSVSKGSGGKFDYIKAQKYIGVVNRKLLRRAIRDIEETAAKGRRISVDLEEGKVDKYGNATKDNSGTSVPLVAGFSPAKGRAWVIPDRHPSAPVTEKFRRICRRVIKRLLTSAKTRHAIKYICHHGSYDVTAAEKFYGVTITDYDFDTNYSEFFTYPDRHSFALAKIAEARFPEFVDYKSVTAPECFTSQFKTWLVNAKKKKLSLAKKYELARKFKGGTNLALLPWEKIVLYNGADNDLQKRIELTTKKVSLPLLHVYQDAQFIVDDMQANPPWYDYSHDGRLRKLYPIVRDRLYKRLVKISGKEDFNPGSPKQVAAVIYDKLDLPIMDEEKPRGTGKEIMAALAVYHKFPMLQTEFRRIDKICGTYLDGFKASADQNEGHVRTIFWLTGTQTGRLSSGGGDSGDDGVVNLQNIHGDPLLQCLLVSDTQWRDIYRYWRKHGDFTEKTWRQFEDYYVFLGFDHSQMELRVVAQKSGDKNLIAYFKSGKDVHALVGHDLTGWSIEKISEDELVRRIIKNMQFGIVFGLTEDNLYGYMVTKGVYKPLPQNPTKADLARVEKERAQVKKFYRAYFEKFSGVAQMIEDDREYVAEHGECETLFGFRRKLNVNPSDEDSGHGYWKNQAINTPIQGTAHQLMLMGLVPLKRKPEKYKLLNKKQQLEIHDAVYFRIKLKFMFRGAVLGQEMLEKDSLEIVKKDFNIDWKVPLKAEPKGAIRLGLQVKDVGGQDPKKPGPKNEWEFLNAWCKKNQDLEKRLSGIETVIQSGSSSLDEMLAILHP